MKRIPALTTVVVMFLAASGVSLAQENPFVGTWKLNLAKSKYDGAQAPKSETRTVVAQGNGDTVTFHQISEPRIAAQGVEGPIKLEIHK